MPSKDDIDGAIFSLGKDGQQFRAKDIRRVLSVETSDRDAVRRVHNRLQSLLKSGAIQTHGRNKRNRPYSITAEGIESSTACRAKPSSDAELDDRLRRIESMLADLHTALFSGDAD